MQRLCHSGKLESMKSVPPTQQMFAFGFEESPKFEIARELEALQIRFGTSSWAYPGWVGNVYSRKHASSNEYLEEYTRYPLFRTVGADMTFYNPPSVGLLKTWKALLPPKFPVVFKVWDEITVDRFEKVDQAGNPRRMQGNRNPHFLDAGLFEDAFLGPIVDSGFQDHLGGLMFEFRSSTARSPQTFLNSLEAFLGALPNGFPYAVEVREPRLLGAAYQAILRNHQVSHVFNHWDRMLPLREQLDRVGLTGDRVISRILTPLGMPYADAKKKFFPYDQLLPENRLPEMRVDVVELCEEAIKNHLPAYVLVNNRAEGYAPMTIQDLQEAVAKKKGLLPLPGQSPTSSS